MMYKGKELKEYISEEPIFFDPPKRMLCWDDDTNSPVKCLAFSYDGRMSMPVYATRDVTIEKGSRIAQFCIMEQQPKLVFEEGTLEGADRGGFGSTGN